MDRDVKQLNRSRIPLVKVRWNSKRGPEFTWECEDQFKKKYPHLFTKTVQSSSVSLSCKVRVGSNGNLLWEASVLLGRKKEDSFFNGMNGGDVTNHIAKVLEITEWIKMPNVEKNDLRLHVCSKSLSKDAKTWWNNEIKGTTITWSELNDKIFHKYYPLSHTCNSEIPDDLDNRTDYFEFIYWLASKFDNYWEIDKNTKNRLWEYYVNERTKGTIGDLDKYNEPCEENTKKTCSDTFYKPYLDAQEAKDIYKVINMEYSPIPILARRDIDNPDELCRTEEFIIIRHSIGDDEEFVTVGPSKINTVKRTPGSMSCIYHELLNRKDRRWEEPYGDLAETMIW
ncbi:hypothetical protein Tco_1326549 [Tanacetum coccineum]